MIYQETAKKNSALQGRRIRWDRVITCSFIAALVAVCGVHSIVSPHTEQDDNANHGYTSPIVTQTTEQGKSDEADSTTVCSGTVTQTTSVTTTVSHVVAENMKLDVHATASAMRIDGEFYSEKLGRKVSVREQQILMMLVLSEGAWEPYRTQVSIASTVLNRVLFKGTRFPDTIEGVVTQDHQFSPVIIKSTPQRTRNGFYNNNGEKLVLWSDYPEKVQESVHGAVYAALDGYDPTEEVGGAIYYCNMRYLTREEMEYRSNIGAIVTFGETTFYREWNK